MMVFFVPGIPVQQGSKRHVGNGIMVEDAKEKLMPWRDSITYAAREASTECLTGPVSVSLTFYFPRPKSHYRANGQLKDTAPRYKSSRPDLDKLIRAVLDAMTAAGVWRDDSQVAALHANKAYGEPREVGLAVSLRSLT